MQQDTAHLLPVWYGKSDFLCSYLLGATSSEPETEQIDKEGWPYVGDFSGAPRVGCGVKDVAPTAQHIGQH